MNSNLLSHINQLKSLCTEYKVDRVHLFGSQATNSYTEKSDIDLLVKFSDSINVLDYADNYFGLLEKLEYLFKKKIDLVSERSLKNPILISEINKTKISLV